MRWPLSLAAAALASCALALPASAQVTAPDGSGGAVAPGPAETLPGTPPPDASPRPDSGAAAPTETLPAPTTTPGTTATPDATATTPDATATTPESGTSAPAAGDGDDDGPSPAIVGLLVLAALWLLALLVWGLAHLLAWEPSWLPAARHALGEAGYRTGATWAEFRDWLRLRR